MSASPFIAPEGVWIQTYTGKVWDLENPSPDLVDIIDIAHALSQICRFTGHCTPFYSVAEHSIWVSRLVAPEHALAGLLHDATEAYLGDVSSPLKKLVPEYRLLEARHWSAIAEHFDLPESLHSSIKQADRHMLGAERRLLTTHAPKPDGELQAVPFIPFTGPFYLLPPEVTKRMFLKRYVEILHPELGDELTRKKTVQWAQRPLGEGARR